MEYHSQKELLAIGKTGCYFLSILHLANTIQARKSGVISATELDGTTSILKLFRDAVFHKWCTDECFMNQPDKLMEALLGNEASVTVKHADVSYKVKANEYEITRYEKGSFAHFVCTENGKITYDPYGYAEKDLGKAVSKRIFTVIFR